MTFRKDLSIKGMVSQLGRTFDKVEDSRKGPIRYPLKDLLIATFALFSSKSASLLQYCDTGNEPTESRSLC